jgi:hypothetical protein
MKNGIMTRLLTEVGKRHACNRQQATGNRQNSRDKDFWGDLCKMSAKNNPY